jgi:hypothetical protein
MAAPRRITQVGVLLIGAATGIVVGILYLQRLREPSDEFVNRIMLAGFFEQLFDSAHCHALSGLQRRFYFRYPGRCPGLTCLALSGQEQN